MPNIVPPPETGYLPSIRPPSGTNGAGANAFVLKNSLTQPLTLPPRPALLSVAPGARPAVVYKVAGPYSVPAALSRMLNGSPDCSVTMPEMLQPFPSFRRVAFVASSGPGTFHVPLITNR